MNKLTADLYTLTHLMKIMQIHFKSNYQNVALHYCTQGRRVNLELSSFITAFHTNSRLKLSCSTVVNYITVYNNRTITYNTNKTTNKALKKLGKYQTKDSENGCQEICPTVFNTPMRLFT
jgi:hypothetical protein